jgi:hypothetical protein
MLMSKFNFHVQVSTERATGRVLAVYFQVREGKAAKVDELADGAAFANYSSSGKLLGVELLGPCEIKILDRIVRRDPDVQGRNRVKQFFRRTGPPEMVLG